MRATEVRMEVTLVVEYPEGAQPLDTSDLGDWLSDQLDIFITLPFDGDRKLLDTLVEPFGDGKEIDY